MFRRGSGGDIEEGERKVKIGGQRVGRRGGGD